MKIKFGSRSNQGKFSNELVNILTICFWSHWIQIRIQSEFTKWMSRSFQDQIKENFSKAQVNILTLKEAEFKSSVLLTLQSKESTKSSSKYAALHLFEVLVCLRVGFVSLNVLGLQLLTSNSKMEWFHCAESESDLGNVLLRQVFKTT